MGFSEHTRALQQDLSYRAGCLNGLAHVTAIKERIEARKREAVDPEVEEAVVRLGVYFEQLCEGLGEAAFKVAVKKELGGEELTKAEADLLAKAETKQVTTTIDKSTAADLAKLVTERTKSWEE
jgi:hypothetical protein